MEVLGTSKSVADALVIRTLMDILEETGLHNLTVDINSMGDGDSRPVYMRALTAYYRKHIDTVCAHCRERLKSNPLRLLDCKDEKCAPLKAEAPDSVSFLSQAGKQHFKEVLEYLDNREYLSHQSNACARIGLLHAHSFEIIANNADEKGRDRRGQRRCGWR